MALGFVPVPMETTGSCPLRRPVEVVGFNCGHEKGLEGRVVVVGQGPIDENEFFFPIRTTSGGKKHGAAVLTPPLPERHIQVAVRESL